MPIEVIDADGTVIEFPDGTDNQTITGVMRRRDQERQARTRSGDPRVPGSVAGAIAGQAGARAPGPRARGQRGTWQEEVGGALANINRGIPFAQDVVNFAGGVRGALSGEGFQEGMRGQQAQSQALQQDFRNRRPNAAAFAEGTGNATGLLPLGGAAVAQQGATRGLPLFLGQTRNAAITGAGAGAAFGFSTGDAPNEDLSGRLDAATQAAGAGALFGAATPAAVNTIGAGWRATSPLREAIGRGVNRLPEIAPQAQSGAGSFGGQMFGGRRPPLRAVPPAPPPEGPRIPPQAMGTIDRLANRNRMTPEQVEAAFAEARRNPQGQVVADLFGDAGVRTTRAIAQGPGQTGGRAAEVARERFQAAPDRILNELNRRLAVAETPEQAMTSLERQYAEASRELYEPLWAQPMAREVRETAGEFLRRYERTPAYQDAARRAREIFDLDVANGRASGALDDNFARYLHYLKMGVDDMVRDAPRAGIQATQRRAIREMQQRIIATADRAIPGYREARNRWSTLSNAQEALEDGATLINQNSGAIRQRMTEMTDFERYHARVGFANAIANRIGLRGSQNGNRNVAEALGSPEMQRRVSAMFDSPEEAASFLDTLNQQNMLMRNAGQWGSGSQTYSNALHGADEALNMVSDMGVNAATGNVPGIIRRGVQGGANALTMGAIERANNVRGEALLRRVDTDDAADFARAVVEELRRRDAARRTASAVSQTGAAATGSQQGRDRR